MATDTELLSRYAHEGCEEAFAHLVQMHQRLVIGAAYRFTGDLELARDVAQEVFAGLACKARQLAGRDSLAGWLYRASSYKAVRARQSEARREKRHQKLESDLLRESGGAGGNSRLELLDDALKRLSDADQEVIVLHYFEDLSYAEIAARLGESEAALRKRSSRAVEQLGQYLRRRGVSASAAGLLVGAAATQASLPAQAGLAQTALTTAAATPWPLTLLSTAMSSTASKLAAAAVVVVSIPVAGEWIANQSAKSAIVHERERLGQNAAPTSTSSDDAQRVAALQAKIAEVSAQLRRQTKLREQEEANVHDLERKQAQLKAGEVVVSFGDIESLAGRLSDFLRRGAAMKHTKYATEAERNEAARKVATELFSEAGADMTAARDLERDPAKAAHFYASFLAGCLSFDSATTAKTETLLTQQFDVLRAAGLASPQRPLNDDPNSDWAKRRYAAMGSMFTAMEALAPQSDDRDWYLSFLEMFLRKSEFDSLNAQRSNSP
ncbi:MAG TPA: sigma-70 family RNA polymerase sigma factor [Chthoniobacteraceae bacterium]|jgi:RNA polymerase sigma factor (sigma-70 family)